MDILYFGSDGMIRALGDTNFFSHYNHNHDKLGRFARSNGISQKTAKKLRKDSLKYYDDKKRNTTERSKVALQARVSLKNSPEYKKSKQRFDKASRDLQLAEIKEMKYLEEKYDNDPNLESVEWKKLDEEHAKKAERFEKISEEHRENTRKIANKFLDAYAEATIKDLKIRDKKGVRDFIIKRSQNDFWYREEIPVDYDYIPFAESEDDK